MEKEAFIFPNESQNWLLSYNVVKLGDFYYSIDLETGKILFKTKYEPEIFDYFYFEFSIGDKVYITEKDGTTLLKADLDKYNSVIDKPYSDLLKAKEEIEEKHEKLLTKFKDKEFDDIYECFRSKRKYYKAQKNKLWGVVDKNGETVIDFKYLEMCSTNFRKSYKLCFVVQDCETKKYGIIDINENIVIPFCYDYINSAFVYPNEERLIATKTGKDGVIDINNNVIIDFKFKFIYGYDKSLGDYTFAENEEGNWGVIDRLGNPLHFNLKKVKEINLDTLNKEESIFKKIEEQEWIPEKLMELYNKIYENEV